MPFLVCNSQRKPKNFVLNKANAAKVLLFFPMDMQNLSNFCKNDYGTLHTSVSKFLGEITPRVPD